MAGRPLRACLVAWVVVCGGPARAFDLAAAEVTRLDNGLTLLVLEDRSLPVVSVQMLYRVGARDEAPGTTGVAHFMEHMAFRASEHFPDTELASRIYAVGGEWHAYTWIDQTTYYETAPREELDLLLRIEADRMARLLVPADEVEAERGAVLAELHGYENDPAAVLYDAVLATSFLQHPYRYNTIGWESDVQAISRDDLLAFYRRHYTPANAVLAVVGDVDPAEVSRRVRELFGPLAGGAPAPPPRTREPEQGGERRIEVRGGIGPARFAIAWRAPAVSDPDWPSFLLLREVLGGGDGVNFQQEEFGVPVGAGTRLAGLPAETATYFIPTADPYVLLVSGSVEDAVETAEVERAVELALRRLREEPVDEGELDAARDRLAEDLLFDVQTTEDAAHQLAYFEGLGARDVLLSLPERLGDVTPGDLTRVARRWLGPERRTVGWYLPSPRPAGAPAASDEAAAGVPASLPPHSRETDTSRTAATASSEPREADTPDTAASAGGDRDADASAMANEAAGPPAGRTPVTSSPTAARAGEPLAVRLSSGLPAVVQAVPGRGTVFVGVLLPTERAEVAAGEADVVSVGDPVWRHTWLGWRGRAEEAVDLVVRARRTVAAAARARAEGWSESADTATAAPTTGGVATDDPADLVEASLREQLGIQPVDGGAAPVLLVVVGEIEPQSVVDALESAFGGVAPGTLPPAEPPRVRSPQRRLEASARFVQTDLGWAVPAPRPSDPESLAWRMLLYVLAHGYEGRLGVEAIARRGLLYWIGTAYHSDGRDAWIELSMGVDPEKLAPLLSLFRGTLEGLAVDAPSEAELTEARRHLLGRRVSAYQSPAEIAAFLAAEWVDHGRIRPVREIERSLASVTRTDVLAALARFRSGALAWVAPSP